MENKLTKKYSFFTALGLVIGIVIGSGVFYKAQELLNHTNGNLLAGVFAWVLGGLIMIISSYTFSILATRYENLNGLIAYSEKLVSKEYGMIVGSYSAYFFNPSMTGVLAWVSAIFFQNLFNLNISQIGILFISLAILIFFYLFNLFTPKLSGLFQISTTYIKMLPLIIVGVLGIIYGLINHEFEYSYKNGEIIKSLNETKMLISNFKFNTNSIGFNNFFKCLVATAFAYEGWNVATSINSEIKNPKKNLPKALVIGTFLIMLIYITYYIGLAGAADINILRKGGVNFAFDQLFGKMSVIMKVFVLISCLGTTNGLMMANVRALYSLSVRNYGPFPSIMKKVYKKNKMPKFASIISLLLATIWFLAFFIPTFIYKRNSIFKFDITELPIIFIYIFYILIYINMMIKEKDLNKFKRFVVPIFALLATFIMLIALFYSHKEGLACFLFYLYITYFLVYVVEYFNKRKKITYHNLKEGLKIYDSNR